MINRHGMNDPRATVLSPEVSSVAQRLRPTELPSEFGPGDTLVLVAEGSAKPIGWRDVTPMRVRILGWLMPWRKPLRTYVRTGPFTGVT